MYMYNYRTVEMWNHVYMILCYKHKYIYKYVHKFMHMYMYHEYESVYEYGSNAFELNVHHSIHAFLSKIS